MPKLSGVLVIRQRAREQLRSGPDDATALPRKKTAAVVGKQARDSYVETERRNMRSILSFVASQQDWLACAAARAWLAALCAPPALWLAARASAAAASDAAFAAAVSALMRDTCDFRSSI